MNQDHLELCASDAWRDLLRDEILPYALRDARLGDDVLEVGPGPGMTTDLLRQQVTTLTALELDRDLAAALAERLAATNVTVVQGDATDIPFEDGGFSGAVALTMLHHVPTEELQDRLFREVARVLQAGGQLVAADSLHSVELEAFHAGDPYNPVDPSTLADRLGRAGFGEVAVRVNPFGWAAVARRAEPGPGEHRVSAEPVERTQEPT